jgi:capsular exopolysaccharide synthesis family protein
VPSVARDLLAHSQPMSSAAESLRTIRTNLMFMSSDSRLRSLVITSGSPREGKTTIATNLAISVAQSGKRVLLVDTDMRRPRLHQALGVEARPGLTNILVGESTLTEVVQPTLVPGLSLLVCGPVPPNPSELLHRERFQQLTREVAAAYDFVIYDSPPLGPVTDAAILGTQVDGVLVVVKALHTTTDSVRSIIRQLGDVQANMIGVVINGFDPRHSRYDSGGGYYYYRRDTYYTADADGEPPSDKRPPRDDGPTPPAVN